MATKDELVKTNEQLQRELDTAKLRFDGLDPEAKAFDMCVRALNVLKNKGTRMGSDYSLDRVVDALRARFNLGQDKQEDAGDYWVDPGHEPDPRDAVITQMIDALRRG